MQANSNKKNSKAKTLAFVGILSAMVFVTSSLYIPVGQASRLHLGNVVCLLGGLLFGPLVGGLAAGLGSMIFDLTNPIYVKEFWITFINKFAMGFIAGLLNHVLLKKLPDKLRPWLAAAAGALAYVVLYLGKSLIIEHYVNGLAWFVVRPLIITKAGVSVLNGALAAVGSVLLFFALGRVRQFQATKQ